MNQQQERNYVASLYKGKRWQQKVTQMSSEQVHAIFCREYGKPKKGKEQS